MTTVLFGTDPVDSIDGVWQELIHVKSALARVMDRLTDEEYLDRGSMDYVVKTVLDEGLEMAIILKRFQDLLDAAGEINRNSKKRVGLLSQRKGV